MDEGVTSDPNQLTESAVFFITALLILIDVIYAGLRTVAGRPDAENFLEYLVSRVTVIVLISVARIVETLLPNVPLVYLTCLFYSAISVAHIIDAARKDNVPIPPPLVGALRSLKDAVGGSEEEERARYAADEARKKGEG